MNIKQNSVRLLRERVNELRGSLSASARSGEEFKQAERAMAKLHELNSGMNEKGDLRMCHHFPIIDG